MPAALKITLTPEQSETLRELRVANSVNHRVRDRAHMLLLNADDWNVASIADIFKCHEHTVRTALKRWQKEGLYGLWEKGGRGQKPTWQPADLDYLEDCLEAEERTYNSRQLAAKLATERDVHLSPDRIRKLLKKKGYRWKRTRHSHRQRQNPTARAEAEAQLIELEALAASGHILLKYLDETGCSQWTPVSYSYSKVGKQKRFEQTSRRGQRVSILGIWDADESFDYALVLGGFNGERYIEVMNWVAQKANVTFAKTGTLTFIVQDNCSIHKSKAVQQHWKKWRQQGLIVLFLPPYCSELNPIEGQWHQLKNHELAGRMFEYEDELVEAIVDGMIDRSVRGGYDLDRFIFNLA